MFEGVGPTLIAARHERRASLGNRGERRDRSPTTGDVRWVRARADHDEVIPGDLPALGAVALGDELLLGLGIVHQHQIGVAPRRRRQRLARTLCENAHRDAGLVGEFRQDAREQPRIFDRGCRGQHDCLAGAGPAGDQDHAGGQDRRYKSKPHPYPSSSAPSAKMVALTATLMPISTSPRPRAIERLPLLVSRTIVVVIVRV